MYTNYYFNNELNKIHHNIIRCNPSIIVPIVTISMNSLVPNIIKFIVLIKN